MVGIMGFGTVCSCHRHLHFWESSKRSLHAWAARIWNHHAARKEFGFVLQHTDCRWTTLRMDLQYTTVVFHFHVSSLVKP